MASGSRSRPAPFSPGTLLSRYFRVQALVRLSETRMFYLVDDDRPDRDTRHCWHCGSDETPKGGGDCVSCGMPVPARRQFLMSARWHRATFEAYTRFFDRGLVHPGILTPEDVFFHEGLLCSVLPYNNETLLLDESSPFPMERILHLAQRFAGLSAFLHHHGVRLSALDRTNFLLRPDEDRFYLFDPDIAEIYEEPVPESERGGEICSLAEMLIRYVPVNVQPLQEFFRGAMDGAFENPMTFGRAIEGLYGTLDPRPVPPSLAAMSDVGLLRILNEDNWGWAELDRDVHLYVVADGMGGHDSGEVASQVSTDTICKVAQERFKALQDRSPESLEAVLDEAFQSGNNTVKDLAEARRNDMGTTMVAMMICRHLGLIANVGDSRAYLNRDGVLYQISRDHSLVARMVEQGRITAEEARTHPHSNILLRTVGTERNVEIDIFRVDLEPGDRLLLCSDGLWGEVEDEDIEGLMNQYLDPRICARELLRAAHRGGGKDNITLIQVGVEAEGML